MGRVAGKVAIVTGAARGMGASHARRLVEEGASVVLGDILDDEVEALADALGQQARACRLDVTLSDEWRKIVEIAESTFGPVSVLVNNAGIAPTWTGIEQETEAAFRRMFEINQLSVFLGMRAIVSSMRQAGGGSIINISSVAGIVGSPNATAYTGSKFAVRGMTKSAAIELAPLGIRVNSIHPGLVRTAMVEPSLIATAISATPAGRLGEAEEISAVVLLLASDETRFTTGAEFIIDGGFSCQ